MTSTETGFDTVLDVQYQRKRGTTLHLHTAPNGTETAPCTAPNGTGAALHYTYNTNGNICCVGGAARLHPTHLLSQGFGLIAVAACQEPGVLTIVAQLGFEFILMLFYDRTPGHNVTDTTTGRTLDVGVTHCVFGCRRCLCIGDKRRRRRRQSTSTIIIITIRVSTITIIS